MLDSNAAAGGMVSDSQTVAATVVDGGGPGGGGGTSGFDSGADDDAGASRGAAADGTNVVPGEVERSDNDLFVALLLAAAGETRRTPVVDLCPLVRHAGTGLAVVLGEAGAAAGDVQVVVAVCAAGWGGGTVTAAPSWMTFTSPPPAAP